MGRDSDPHLRRGFTAAILRYLVPEVKRDDPLWYSISTTIYQDLVNIDFISRDHGGWNAVSLYDLDVAVIPLPGFHDIDRCSIRSRNATFWLLSRQVVESSNGAK